jgi:hypothetical protein
LAGSKSIKSNKSKKSTTNNENKKKGTKKLKNKVEEKENDKSRESAKSEVPKERLKDNEEGKVMDEEEMLDIAEHCFIKLAESMIEKNRSVRGIFTKYSIPEQFPDGSILELMSPISFLEGIKELGI